MILVQDEGPETIRLLKQIEGISDPEQLVQMLGNFQGMPAKNELLLRRRKLYNLLGPRDTVTHALFARLIKMLGERAAFKLFHIFTRQFDIRDEGFDDAYFYSDCDEIFSAQVDLAEKRRKQRSRHSDTLRGV